MARTISSETLACLQAGRVDKSDMLLFDFPSGTYGFFSGTGSFLYNGVTYRGFGKLFVIDQISAASDGTAVPLTLKLNASPEDGLTPDVLAQIESEQYQGRPVIVSRAYFHPDTYALLSVETVYRGYIDTIDHVENAASGEAYLEAQVESRALDLGRSGYRLRTDADQRLIDPTDGSLRYVHAAATAQIYWGRAAPVTAGQTTFKSG